MQGQRTENGTKTENEVPNQDLIQRIMGSFGKYQVWICFLIFLNKVPMICHQMAILFLSPKMPYYCSETNTNDTCPCENPVYDTSIFTSTIISEWDLICERRWLTSFTQTLFQLGTLLGSVFFGMASDRFGRKKPLLVAAVMQVSMGIVAAYMPDFWSFTFIRLLVGMSVGGTAVVGFVIIIEFIGAKYRDVVSAAYQIPFNLGHMMLPLFSYFFRDFRDFQLSISIPAGAMLIYFFFLPDTPRWLIAMKRTDEAVNILERVAKINGRPTENIKSDIEVYQIAAEKIEIKKGGILDLVRTPNLRKNIFAMSFNWLTCSYCFYGVSQYVGQLGGDVFVNVTISASMTLIGTLLSIPLMKIIGRRTIVILSQFSCGICLLILAVIPEGIGSVIFASIGVVTSFIVFVVVYLYCSELFPTVVRNAAMGCSSMMARVGSMIAPFILELDQVATWLPPLAFAILPLFAGCFTFLLPETKGCELTTTIEEGENFGNNCKKPKSEAINPSYKPSEFTRI